MAMHGFQCNFYVGYEPNGHLETSKTNGNDDLVDRKFVNAKLNGDRNRVSRPLFVT
jgi:hypothetical protein